ncbi:MAG: SDR family NAD(P)-dependent oxidoreductase [Pseudomonadota bacterium]|nr:SDR family NAD(P)-dependent oxidoreductase [Pseudomonadota bacterium]
MKTALITGASQGIGAAIAEKLNKKKIKVILVSRSKKRLRSFQKNLKFPKNSFIISKDLRSLSACNSLLKKIKKLDYLINVAGATKGGKFLDLNDNVWEDGFNLKFKAAVRLSRAFWPALKRSKGKVINIGGGAARNPSNTFMIGGAVNSALNNFSKALAAQGKIDKISVSIIHPGMTLTSRLEKLLKTESKIFKRSIKQILKQRCKAEKIKRPTEPEEVANLVYKLIKDKNSNFKNLSIDGGKIKNLK